MNKVLIPLLILVLAGLVYLFAFKNETQGAREAETSAPALGGPQEAPSIGESIGAKEPSAGSDSETKNQDQPVRRRRSERQSKEYPQGIRGRIVTSQGGPAVGAKIYLVRTLPATDMLGMIIAAQQAGTQPLSQIGAQGVSGANGAFQLGAAPSEGEHSYELHVVAPGHSIFKKPVRVQSGKWEDLQLLRLSAGHKLTGFVRDAKSKAPIEGAIVRVTLPQTNLLQATPGFEEGATGISDAKGRYVVDNLPMGSFTVKAVARGYGSVFRDDLTFGKSDRQQSMDFQLGGGFVISGFVTDAQGKGISRAQVEALAFSRENQQPNSCFTDDEGKFELLGLEEGSYRLLAKATGYIEGEQKPVRAGNGVKAEDVQIVLETLGQARVTVTSKQGRALTAYRLELRSYFEGEGEANYGRSNVPAQEMRANRDGSSLFSGIPQGNYVFQVTAIGYAKTYSKNFTSSAGQTSPIELRIQMNQGGTITGTVTDASGNPISAVSIKTQENSYQDNPFFKAFKDFIPKIVTHTATTTNDKGRFTLSKLTPGTYQIVVDHPAYTRMNKTDIVVQEAQKNELGTIRLNQGGTVSGKVFFQGRPVAGAEVTISGNSGEGNKAQPFWEKTFTGPDGSFKISRPLPEGTYEINAARTDLPNPFLKMKDLQTSKKEIRVFGGRDNPVQIYIKP
ncbi:MAG: hypothetical protein CSA62_11115 [Planctomycetota bacterium]|nr:MAG: hypothetical protein CSA62_11115 [Planctomycetota bacterium]